jgi:hypothetical protein
MVAYSFKPSFVAPIQALEKQQTIRLPRKRLTKVGEPLSFFTGPRMRPVRIGSATCVAFHQVRLDFCANTVTLDDAVVIDGSVALNEFAVRDGFGFGVAGPIMTSWEYMARWWRLTHPDQPIFAGHLIDWGQTFREPAA